MLKTIFRKFLQTTSNNVNVDQVIYHENGYILPEKGLWVYTNLKITNKCLLHYTNFFKNTEISPQYEVSLPM